MKAYVIKAVKTVDYSRNYMLARVVLHIAKAKIKIQLTVIGLSHTQRLIGEVKYFTVFYLHVRYIRAAYISAVALLTAALGEKCGSV